MTEQMPAQVNKTVMRMNQLGELKSEIDLMGVALRNRFKEYADVTAAIHSEDNIATATKFKDDIVNAAWDKYAFPSTDVIPSMPSEDEIEARALKSVSVDHA